MGRVSRGYSGSGSGSRSASPSDSYGRGRKGGRKSSDSDSYDGRNNKKSAFAEKKGAVVKYMKEATAPLAMTMAKKLQPIDPLIEHLKPAPRALAAATPEMTYFEISNDFKRRDCVACNLLSCTWCCWSKIKERSWVAVHPTGLNTNYPFWCLCCVIDMSTTRSADKMGYFSRRRCCTPYHFLCCIELCGEVVSEAPSGWCNTFLTPCCCQKFYGGLVNAESFAKHANDVAHKYREQSSAKDRI